VAVERAPGNPVLTPTMVPPSRPDFEVKGVFNPAAVQMGDETVLLLRVAEAPKDVDPAEVAAPILDPASGRVEVRRWRRDTPGLRAEDPRVFTAEGATYLTSISHLRRARSADGFRFEVEGAPALTPEEPSETFGVEDPRVTAVQGAWWVTYTAVSPWGIAAAAAVSPDLRRFSRRGLLFAPPNRDVALFPEMVGGRYLALHRPMTEGIGRPSIWLASSPDLVSWGRHVPLAAPRSGCWDDVKVGAGAPPFRVHAGGAEPWLALYHGVGSSPRAYSLGALLLEGGDPSRVLGRSREPFLVPEASYERHGFFGNVVFTCGAFLQDGRVRVYYGAADAFTAVADVPLDDILAGLE
jgi:predicted GH43/DUF377 family glycosyl hydrolase